MVKVVVNVVGPITFTGPNVNPPPSVVTVVTPGTKPVPVMTTGTVVPTKPTTGWIVPICEPAGRIVNGIPLVLPFGVVNVTVCVPRSAPGAISKVAFSDVVVPEPSVMVTP